MPPKQAQKGNKQQSGNYKAAALAKDVLPAWVKNAPREGRPSKVPEA